MASSSAIRLASARIVGLSSRTTDRIRFDIVSACRPMRAPSSARVSEVTCSGEGSRCAGPGASADCACPGTASNVRNAAEIANRFMTNRSATFDPFEWAARSRANRVRPTRSSVGPSLPNRNARREGLLGAPPGVDAQGDVDDVARGEDRLVLPASAEVQTTDGDVPPECQLRLSRQKDSAPGGRARDAARVVRSRKPCRFLRQQARRLRRRYRWQWGPRWHARRKAHGSAQRRSVDDGSK